MANLTVKKDFMQLELVQDSAVIQVDAKDYILAPEVFAKFTYKVIGQILPWSGMRFEINGVAITWWSIHNISDYGQANNQYSALVEDTSVPTTFSNSIVASRIVAALKQHPNYAAFSKLADVVYVGDATWYIAARNAGDIINRYTTFDLSALGAGTQTFTPPAVGIMTQNYIGSLATFYNPHQLAGSALNLRADFKLIVDVRVDYGEIITENYYPDATGFAEIDVAGIVNRFFAEKNQDLFVLNGPLMEVEVNALKKFEVKVSSYYSANYQEELNFSSLALNGYTGKKNRSNHVADLERLYRAFFATAQRHKWLTAKPSTSVVPADVGEVLHIVIALDNLPNESLVPIRPWTAAATLNILVTYKDNSYELVTVLIDPNTTRVETYCLRVRLSKTTLASKISGVWADVKSLQAYIIDGVSNVVSQAQTIYLNHKKTGTERVFSYRNRYGVKELITARVGVAKAFEINKEIASPMQKWDNRSTAGNEVVYAASGQNIGSAELGFFGVEYAEMLKDFLASKEHYILENDLWVSVRIKPETYDLESSTENLKPLAFDFTYNFIKRT